MYSVSQKKSPVEITLLLLNVCYYTSGNINELNMNSSSLRQNNLTKTFAQINDCLFIYMKFKAMDFNMSPISVDAKNGLFLHMAYCITDHYFQAAAVKH